MPKSQEYYVAFSIHRSYCFITANKVTDDVQKAGTKIIIDGFSFTQGQSRDRPLRGAIKLLSTELEDKGRPSSNPSTIHAFFMKLREAGWTVDDAAFIKKHGLKPVEIPAASPETEAPKTDTKTDFHTETPPGRTTEDKPAVEVPAPGSVDDGTYEGNEAEKALAAEHAQKDAAPETIAKENTVGFERIDGSIRAVQGDITKIEADAIVNAANAQLIPGGGVDGAINRAAGPELAKAMAAFGGCQTGYTVVTDSFDLKTATHIIHAVGPIYKDYEPIKAAELLRSAYENALSQARVLDCETVALPLLSTGVYGYPMDEACAIAVQVAHEFNTRDGQKPLGITFVAFDDAAYAILRDEIAKVTHS